MLTLSGMRVVESANLVARWSYQFSLLLFWDQSKATLREQVLEFRHQNPIDKEWICVKKQVIFQDSCRASEGCAARGNGHVLVPKTGSDPQDSRPARECCAT